MVPASVTLLTAEHPYGALIDYGQRRQAEYRSAILNVSIFGNFLFSDTPDKGLSIVVTARHDMSHAKALALELAEAAWSRTPDFVRDLTSVGDAVAIATELGRHTVIFSSAEYCLRVLRRMPLNSLSDASFDVPEFVFIFAP